jgi:hypothetical protein
MNLYEHPTNVNKLDLPDLIERAQALQTMYTDCQADITRVRDVVRSTRSSGTYDFVRARKEAATQLAEMAMSGIVPTMPMPEVSGADDTTLKLTLEGLTARVGVLEERLSHIKSAHRVTVLAITRKHSATAGERYIQARQAYVEATAAVVGLDQALSAAGLPSDQSIVIGQEELPILFSEKNGSPAWNQRLSFFLQPHLKSMQTNYRSSLLEIGVRMRLGE